MSLTLLTTGERHVLLRGIREKDDHSAMKMESRNWRQTVQERITWNSCAPCVTLSQ